MSTTYDLCCPEMKLKIWVGQSRMGMSFYLYSEDEEVMSDLSKFLMLTEGKRLVFVSEYNEDQEIIDCEYYKG
jgi:hypothetical protein